MAGGVPQPAPSRSPSRNSVFFNGATTPSPPRPLKPKDKNTLQPARFPPGRRGHAKKPSFGRVSMEERESEQARIHADKSLAIRLFLEREYRLGKGRNADVFLGAYCTPTPHEAPADWRLCAIKRVIPDQCAQLAGLDEAFALRRLGPQPGIVKLIGVLDELGLRQSHAVRSEGSAQIENPPRLLIVLEYLPHTLDMYVRAHPQAVDLRQWHAWALELASTLAWLHGRGYVHGDIKKQNVLLDHDLHTRLCDFSAVLFVNAPVPATDVCEIGTPAFRAPELYDKFDWQPSGEEDAHPALSYTLDIFSLGVLLYSLATGEDPSERGSMLALRRRQAVFFSSEEHARLQRIEIGSRSPTLTPMKLHSVSDDAIARLLDPSPEPRGVISDDRVPQSPSSGRNSLVLRSQSLREPRRPRSLMRMSSDRGVPRDIRTPDVVSQMAGLGLDCDDHRSYRDGLPALILPGGGRLPDELRDLIEAMVQPTPEARPTAAAVVAALQAHSVA